MELLLPWPGAILSPNSRIHWGRKGKATKLYRAECAAIASRYTAPYPFATTPAAHLAVTYLFFPPDRRQYDLDNLHARMKSGQDGIADALHFDDRRIRRSTCEFGEIVPGGSVTAKLSLYLA